MVRRKISMNVRLRSIFLFEGFSFKLDHRLVFSNSDSLNSIAIRDRSAKPLSLPIALLHL